MYDKYNTRNEVITLINVIKQAYKKINEDERSFIISDFHIYL